MELARLIAALSQATAYPHPVGQVEVRQTHISADGHQLLAFYTAYRAAVRGKVKGIEQGEKEIPETDRIAARERSRAHWLLALGEPGGLLLCRAEPEVVQARLHGRQGDASDADWSIYQHAAAHWEEPAAETQRRVHEIATGGSVAEGLSQAAHALRGLGLLAAET